MNHGIGIAATALAAAGMVLPIARPPAAQAHTGANCVDRAEWRDLLTDPKYGDEDHSARRGVIESAWRVKHVGARDQYWQPVSDDFYALAYRFCGSRTVLIVLVYRVASGAWQYALKGEFD